MLGPKLGRIPCALCTATTRARSRASRLLFRDKNHLNLSAASLLPSCQIRSASSAASSSSSWTDGDDIQVPTSPSKGNRRNDVVTSFFFDSSSKSGDSTGDLLKQEIKSQAQTLSEFLSTTRRKFHQHPELMYQEKETSKLVQSILQKMDIPYSTGWSVNTNPDKIPGPGGYGVVADIGTGEQPCILLRADMDALPIHEQTSNVEQFKSQSPGKMHACGHDGHTTMLLGAASILKQMEDSLEGTVRLMFQPAEEGGAGAKRMVEEGVTRQHPAPQWAFGLHVWPTIPSGSIAARPGPILGAAERFEITIEGTGGHAAMPHLTKDPIVTASAMIMNLQTVISRTTNPLDAGVVSITKMQAGDAFNVIPDKVLLRGTLRALSTETLMALRDKSHEVMEATAALYGCQVKITYSPDFYPPTVNDPALYENFSQGVGAIVSEEGYVRHTQPTMAGEDFSFLTEQVPSTFFLLGQGSGTDPPTNYGLHHPKFALDESVMSRGVELHVNLALRGLHRLKQQQQSTNHDSNESIAA